MKVAVVGSRGLIIENIGRFLPQGVSEIISGGAKGVDSCAREYAETSGIALTELLPDYGSFGRYAPLKRNLEIVAAADFVLVFWDARSRGTEFTIDACRKANKPACVFIM